MRAAVFLDRDGVLVADAGPHGDPARLDLLSQAPDALSRLHDAGLLLVLATNQTAVARGLASEAEVEDANNRLSELLVAAGGPPLDAQYFCPHHPEATVEDYRVACDCRKPRPGLLTRAAVDHRIDLARSFMVGDRISDVAAGAAAGCRTVLVRSGRHADPQIVSPDPIPDTLEPDHVADGINGAANWILLQTRSARK